MYVGETVEKGFLAFAEFAEPLLDAVSGVTKFAYSSLTAVLSTHPVVLVGIIGFVAMWRTNSWWRTVPFIVGVVLISWMDMLESATQTTALVAISVAVAVAIGFPLGLWAGVNRRVEKTLQPLWDLMQTMPAFVYLIPTVMMFATGAVPGIVATVIFAMAPIARLTALGVKNVDMSVLEAAQLDGAGKMRILRSMQMPLAKDEIGAGLNQSVLLAFSMVVIAGMVGTPGLGQEVVSSLGRIDIAHGVEAGLSVVILAIIFDRLTQPKKEAK